MDWQVIEDYCRKFAAADVTSAAIKNTNVIFTPGTRIKEMLSVTKFKRV